jgi:hypothetical protein
MKLVLVVPEPKVGDNRPTKRAVLVEIVGCAITGAGAAAVVTFSAAIPVLLTQALPLEEWAYISGALGAASAALVAIISRFLARYLLNIVVIGLAGAYSAAFASHCCLSQIMIVRDGDMFNYVSEFWVFVGIIAGATLGGWHTVRTVDKARDGWLGIP